MQVVTASGAKIPKIGLGTFELTGDAGYRTVSAALEIGYRHIDTAQRYGNEAEIGAALAASGLARADYFVTTKIWPVHFKRDVFRKRAQESCRKLGLVPDLLLLHFMPQETSLAEAIDMLAEAAGAGLARHIGVSNFSASLVEEAVRRAPRPLAANQVEYHSFLDQDANLAACRRNGMALIAYSPLAQGRVTTVDTLSKIGARYGKNGGQVALRWLIQQDGVVAIPRSSSIERTRANFDVFDFELTAAEMARISALKETTIEKDAAPPVAPVWKDAP